MVNVSQQRKGTCLWSWILWSCLAVKDKIYCFGWVKLPLKEADAHTDAVIYATCACTRPKWNRFTQPLSKPNSSQNMETSNSGM
eukprot:5640774-Amphidinium_carterae.1